MQNISLVPETEAAVYKKPITYFVKYYDKAYRDSNLRTHPVLKVYLGPEVVTGNLINEDASNQATGEDQLFSLIAKNILKEIGVASSPAQPNAGEVSNTLFSLEATGTSSSSHVPRSNEVTSFAHVTTDVVVSLKEVASTISADTATTVTAATQIAADPTVESPVKKCKLKKKEC